MTAFHCRWRAVARLGIVAAGWAAPGAWASPAPPFAQLLRDTGSAPRIEVLDADVARAQGLERQARARPNPTVNVLSENFAGSRIYGGFGRTETTVQFNQPIELGGKRSARIAAGTAEVTAARARGEDGRVAYAYDLARAYAGVEVAERRIDLAEDEVEEAGADLRVAQALVAAGKDSRLRSLQAQTEVETLQAELEGARANRAAALARLSALAGVDVPFTGIDEQLLSRLDARPAVGPIDPMQNTAFRAAEAERIAAERRVTAERRKAVPDVTAQVGVRRLEIDKANAVIAGFTIPLTIFDANRGNIAVAEAEQRNAEARARAAQLDAEAATQSALAQAGAADARMAASRTTFATAQETYRLARIAYESGKAPLAELIAARRRLGEARAVILDAEIARFDAQATLARLRGQSITGEAVQ